MHCRICRSRDLAAFSARQHLTSNGNETFTYHECHGCGCLQIAELPTDLASYYGGSYGTTKHSALKSRLRSAAYRLTFRNGLAGKIVGHALPFAHAGLLTALRQLDIPPTASFLDVGSGAGRMLEGLRALGFTGALVGVDPFLPHTQVTTTGVQLRREALEDVEESFDVVTLIHTLEHIADQRGTLRAIERALAPSGVCVISIPVAGSRVWHEYGTDWVQLDPPRHLILHTPESLGLVAADAGLTVQHVLWDSTSFQFWGSELVRRRAPILPLWRSYVRSAWRLPFDTARAARANARGHGDQATFVLTPTNR